VVFVVSLSLLIAVSLFLLFVLPHIRGLRDSRDDGAGGGVAVRTDRRAAARPVEPPLPDTLTVAYYNVENLFDFVLDGTEYDEYKPGWFGWTEEVQRKRLENVAFVVAAVGADIIGLSEVENMNVLRELQNELDRMGVPYPYAVVGESPQTAVTNALLSRFPIREKFEHPVEKSRPVLEALIARGGDSLRVFVNHWPSKRHPESTRLAAANILRARIDELPPGADYVITGDFNANYNEFATFNTAGFNDTEGRTGINHVLKTAMPGPKPYSPYRFVCKGEMATCAGCHYNPWTSLPEGERWSYIFRGAKNTLDHILLPQSMFDTLGFSYLRGSFETFTWDGRLLRDGVPYRWQMQFRGGQRYHLGRGYSDHLPIRMKLVRASVLRGGNAVAANADSCDVPAPALVKGDFAVTVDGWMSGDSRFAVARDPRFKRTGTHSLRISGMHETENKTAARATLRVSRMSARQSPRHLTMYIRGSGKLSVRIKRPEGNWENFNAPNFTSSRSIRYNSWSSDRWVQMRFPLPEPTTKNTDVEVQIRAGKGDRLTVWIDQVRLE
jgi:hypothetical protein